MSIAVTEIESVHGRAGKSQVIFYRCQDHLGAWHGYGPVIANDVAFNAEAHKSVVAEKVAERLAAAEMREVIG
jgi:hypothetical protein